MASSQAPELEVADALSIASSVKDVRGVAGLYAGKFGEVAMLFPRERVQGLRRLPESGKPHIEIHVVADFSAGVNLPDLAPKIRDVAQRACSITLGRVDVVFADATDSSQPSQ